MAAIGTETWGSILGPAEKNSVVGLKPSRGLVANDGTIPISSRQDVIGPLTRTVRDAAFLLTSMAGRSDQDERTWDIPFDAPDFTEFCRGADLTGVSIGVPRNAFSLDPSSPIMASFESVLKVLGDAGAKVVDSANFSAASEFKKLNQQIKGIVRSSEFKRDIAKYLKTLETNPNNITSAQDIIEFTKTFPGEDYPTRDIGNFLWAQAEGIDVDSEKYKQMVEHEIFFGGEGGILGALDRYKVDVLVVPSSFNVATDLAAKMGFPELSVPLGFYPENTPVQTSGSKPNLVTVAPGIPYSLTFVGKSFSDRILLQVGHAFEQLTAVREKGPAPFKLPQTESKDVQEAGRGPEL